MMRQWTVTTHIPEVQPQAWIVPHELWPLYIKETVLEEEALPSIPEGSFLTMHLNSHLVLVVHAAPVRQLRQKVYREAAQNAAKMGAQSVGVWIKGMARESLPSVITGLEHGFYRYVGLKSAAPVQSVTVVAGEDQESGLVRLVRIAQAQSLTRDWVNMPPNEKSPEDLALEYQKDAPSSVTFHAYHEQDLFEMGAGGILAVGSGSTRPPVLLEGRYHGNGEGPWLALVGKGITFDSGGISLKPAEGMGRLKGDMAGSAAVMAALRVVADLALPINLMALAPLAENLPGGGAYRPGDVLTMLDNTRVEIISTDAEGRLVLADALTFARQNGAAAVVDIATLTGANVVALGGIRAALITNDASLGQLVAQAGDQMEEPVWELPHDPEYAHLNDSTIADLKNSGGRPAGTVSAGLFIGHFAKETPWAHLDIAGLAFSGQDGAGATGYGAALLVELCRLWSAQAQ
ncbi:MAG: hypothetical protein C7B44_07565 [Sulfobacillus thermosulfidooxidans]|nr:MAG: hypothetical protein C7B44_07565 [Sulfobacillus thermosulfidooxidans]